MDDDASRAPAAAGAIRPATPEDLDAIVRMVKLCGFPDRSAAGWRWVMYGNPDQGDLAPGFILEREGRRAGFVGAFGAVYRHEGGTLQAVMPHTLVTDPAIAGPMAGSRLIRHVMRQPADFHVTLNNNALSAHFLPRLGARPWLGAAGRCYAEWITRPARLASARAHALLRARLGFDPDREIFERAFDLSVRDTEASAGTPAVRPYADCSPAALDDFFDTLASAPAPGRAASRALIEHRMADPDRTAGMVYAAALEGGRITGLAAWLLTKPAADRVEILDIADLLALPGAAGDRARAALLRAAGRTARRAGVAKMRLHFPGGLPRAVLHAPGWPVFRRRTYDSCHAVFPERLSAFAQDWRPGPGDADFFFAFRIPPRLYAGGESPPIAAAEPVSGGGSGAQ